MPSTQMDALTLDPSEQEMLMPGGFAWDDVVALAQVRGGKLSDHIYIRNDLEQIDAAAFRQIYQAMSEI